MASEDGASATAPPPLPSTAPDVMNDPQFDPDSAASEKTADDPDTCRICRGEGTKEEPLFYPCKCSGSIKFVHQDCLMEWLSHSQKKHCELCKTPFRFTKLYHPHMPSSLPTTVFVRRAVIHVLKHLMTWCRGLLVGSVWLLCLPWCMRVIWRALFWCGDGGFAGDLHRVSNYHRRFAASTGSAPTIPAGANATSSANLTGLSLALAPFSQTLNMSAGEPTAYVLIKKFLLGLGPFPDFFNASFTNSTDNATISHTISIRQATLLSDVSFLRSITSHPSINRLILDIIEGQIITVLVVIAFILIFLIREWVVQQQPVINVAAMQALNNPAPRPQQAHQDAEHDPVEEEELPHEQDADDSTGEDDRFSDISDDSLEQLAELDITAEDSTAGSSTESPEIVRKLADRFPETGIAEALVRSQFEKVADLLAREDELGRKILRKELFLWVELLSDRVKEGPQETAFENWIQLRDWAKELEEIIVPPSQIGIVRPTLFEPDGFNMAFSASKRSTDCDIILHSPENDDEMMGPMEGSSQQRPTMPERGQSFLAAEIQRDLEEATRNLPSLPGEPEEQVGDAEGERRSNKSEGSWQQINESDVESKDHSALETTEPAAPNQLDSESDSSEGSSTAGARASDHTAQSLASLAPAPTEQTIVPDRTPSQENVHVAETQPRANQPPADAGLWERTYHWLWGDIALTDEDGAPGANEEHVVQNLADEAPFVQRDAILGDGFDDVDAARDPEVAAAAAQAGIDVMDQDAVEDAEDLEGIMELIGMQGPLVGLFQNALFSAVLISATVAVAVWIPYLWGKVVLLSLGRPVWLFLKLPLRVLSATADLIVDSVLFLGAAAVYWSIFVLRLLVPFIGTHKSFDSAASSTRTVAESAIERVSKLFSIAGTSMNSDYLHLSISSHAALRSLQRSFSEWSYSIWIGFTEVHSKITNMESFSVFSAIGRFIDSSISLGAAVINSIRASLPTISTTNGLSLRLDTGNSTMAAIDPNFEYWTPSDRIIAILAGYIFFAIAGALYLKRGTPFTSSQNGRRVEGIISEVLQQAGGVLKVILIISIEMIAFPLYCGILLDGALLPLFEQATVFSRIEFARTSPWTAGFVHWFVGTCYMFHFALFVSMCRKIMRTGVLYFIRDPDDPTFHPVRDVLERSVTGQLRKIAFSAFVYGALVICCLGGVVWSLYYGFDGVLPIHWATNDPSMEFPLDLLFFNFLTPLVIKLFKPSDGLHEMYRWWFRKCARVLRLSDFLFGEKNPDERGRHVRRTWSAWLQRKKGNVEEPVIGSDRQLLAEDRNTEVYFLFDGKYVRAPASDQVRIRRGQSVFVDVDVFDNRLDGRAEDDPIHGKDSGLTQTVYIPPLFRFRICLFVVAIWLFAAATGVGVTVIPLLFGRRLFSNFMPEGSHINDIYAFSVGVYILGAAAYGIFHLRNIFSLAADSVRHPFNTTYSTVSILGQYAAQAASVVYVYGALILVLPVLFAIFLEFYILIPLHAYLGPGETHVIHIIQDWTLGFLYARIAARILLWNPRSLISRALQAVVRDGYLRPNARLASRAFVLPVAVFFAATLLVPLAVARVANATYFVAASEESKAMVYTLVYPLTLAVGLSAWMAWGTVRATERWRQRIKDEVYLIGERLHNLGERRAGSGIVTAPEEVGGGAVA
ncbi:ERAD-associated E3 ubiquitin-protein ligase doa10 [Lasiodiplodia hormozganensis]|uniref:RING-type E3 ubiquitin transferase n=1 Tax=Lasiodiplodia hormozganensis TaxID=869390 RepID=A0AA39WT70_9PEZI|nr:ERAD-associated E3 ubiquitin-protein ligase doa10 [Lasiodiplodia hormozganensis]